MTTNKKLRWSVASTGNHQGLIVDENTGANIAVAYDKQHAPLLAAAPDLLDQLEALVFRFGHNDSEEDLAALDEARSAIQRATEGRT